MNYNNKIELIIFFSDFLKSILVIFYLKVHIGNQQLFVSKKIHPIAGNAGFKISTDFNPNIVKIS